MAKTPKEKPEDQRRDALLKRLLETPPKPHKPVKSDKNKVAKKRSVKS